MARPGKTLPQLRSVLALPITPRVAAVLALLASPAAAHAQLQVVNTPSENLTLGAWIQPVAELRKPDEGGTTHGFYFRRARLDLTGSILDGRVRFRVYPEFAPTPSLRDLWVEWRTENGIAIRGGQQTVPFDLQRERSMGRAHFGDRALAARRFELAGGRDIGVTGRWASSGGTRQISLGVFGGSGANRKEVSSALLLAARGSLTFGGNYLPAETDLARSPEPVLTIGAGVMRGDESLLRPDPGSGNRLADWTGVTADLHLRWQGVSVAASWFDQVVAPSDGADADTEGGGWFVSGGWVLPGAPAQLSAKHGRARWDRTIGEDDTETALGVTLFHREFELLTRIQLIFEESPSAFGSNKATVLVVEQQVLLGG